MRGGGGGAGREGSDTSAVGFTPQQHGLGCREERGAIPTAGRARRRTTSLHRSPARTTQALLHEKMLSRPSSSHTPPNRCRLPRPQLIPGPAALRARTGAGKSGAGLRAPMGSLGVLAGEECDYRGSSNPENPCTLKGHSGDLLSPHQSPRMPLAWTAEPPVAAYNC